MLIDNVWLTPAMVNELGQQLGVHRTTVARWIDKGTLPKSISMLLNLTRNGDLAGIHSAWSGWKIDIKDGRLLPPNGDPAFEPGHLYAMQLKYQEISALKALVNDLRDQLASDADMSIGAPLASADALASRPGLPTHRESPGCQLPRPSQ